MVVTQSDKLVKCPDCEKIQKATGEQYFICCRRRWDLKANRINNSEDSNDEHNENTTKEDGGSRGSGDQSQSNDKTRSNQDDEPGEEGSGGKRLEFG